MGFCRFEDLARRLGTDVQWRAHTPGYTSGFTWMFGCTEDVGGFAMMVSEIRWTDHMVVSGGGC